MTDKKKRTHALVTPWPISEGLRTWCGRSCNGPPISEESVAGSPEFVTCPDCIQAMRTALGALKTWVPRLGGKS